MPDKIITRPATPEFRDGYDRIFGKKTSDGYTYHTYQIEGAIRTPEIQAALERSMRPTKAWVWGRKFVPDQTVS